MSNLYLLGTAFELFVGVIHYLRKLEVVEGNLESRLPAQMTRLDRSFASSFSKTFKNDSTQPLKSFLKGMGASVLYTINEKGPETSIVDGVCRTSCF